jgi:hypothetical protein
MVKRVNYKSSLITIGIIFAIIIIAYFSLQKPTPVLTDSELIQCIGENSILYVQVGCSHCEDQKDLFGDNIEHINKIDCFFEPEECEGVQGVPSWKMGNEILLGVKTIDELKELTGC